RDYFVDWPHRADDKYAGPWYMRDALTWDLPEEFHHTRWVAERSIANMQRCVDAGTPFFQWASFFDPHPPYVLPEPWASMYDPATLDLPSHTPGEFDGMPPHFARTQQVAPDFSDYQEPGGQSVHGFHSHLHTEEEMRRSLACYYGMISFIDQEIGRMLDYLEASGLAENTLIVFTTDHGHFLGQHGLIAKGPFHYEDVIRVPMIVSWPGHVPAGEVSQSLQSLVDYPQSFLAAAGIDAPGAMQGVNQWPVWTGESEAARQWALVENRHNPTTVDLRTLITERYKVTVYRDAPYGELFDLREDPAELRNRWDDPAYAAIKGDLLLRFVQAEIQREGTRMPRIAGA
ncbi:MAG TPA: sulfatase-like hydrolase/transferase, partial [Caldilineaceae bacterium]|nr:sulfatase-like hydrolase/transferase [Caldilineaceae bacterium]